jgi:hypothetical protein
MSWDIPLALANPGTDVSSSTTGAAAAIAAILPAVAGRTNYITGFEVTGAGATLGSVVNVTVTGVVGGPLNFVLPVVAGVLLAITPLVIAFNRPIPATGPNVAIAVNVPSLGAGNTNAAVSAHGYLV